MASFNIEKRFTLQTVLATVCNCRGLIVLQLARYISPCLGKTSTGLLSLYVCVHNSATSVMPVPIPVVLSDHQCPSALEIR